MADLTSFNNGETGLNVRTLINNIVDKINTELVESISYADGTLTVHYVDGSSVDIAVDGGGGGAVNSVNGQDGDVVLTADDIDDSATTNKFTTQAAKSKLDGIQSGAQVNNISDVNASALVSGNSTTTHYHSSDRNRANHTGVQPTSTISDLDQFVAAYILDENDMASNSKEKSPTQASVVEYVASQVIDAASYTDEEAQNAVGAILDDTDTIAFTFSNPIDDLGSLSADVKADSLTREKMSSLDVTPSLDKADSALQTGDVVVSSFDTGVIQTVAIGLTNSETNIPTSALVKDYVDDAIAGVGGAVSDFAIVTTPINGGTATLEDPILIIGNDPLNRNSGTDLDNAGADAVAVLKLTNDSGSVIPTTSTVDATRRVITVVPDSSLTKGNTYFLKTSEALKNDSGVVANIPNITFSVTFETGFQAILDYATAQGIALPTNLADLETLYIGMKNLGMFNSLSAFSIGAYTGSDANFAKVDWVNPTGGLWKKYANTTLDSGTITLQAAKAGIQFSATNVGLVSPLKWSDLTYINSADWSVMLSLSSNSTTAANILFGGNTAGILPGIYLNGAGRFYVSSSSPYGYDTGISGTTTKQIRTYKQSGQDVVTQYDANQSTRTSENVAPLSGFSRHISYGAVNRLASPSIQLIEGVGTNGVFRYFGIGRDLSGYHTAFNTLFSTYLSA